MSVLSEWNDAPREQAEADIRACCGSRSWAAKVCAERPFADGNRLLRSAAEVWWSLEEQDWLEAFACHPQIGETLAAKHSTAQSAAWSSEEQSKYADAEDEVKRAMAQGNREYKRQNGFIHIVCASGKTPSEMLAILRGRLGRDRAAELREAALQQQQIMELRLRKWLSL